MTAAPTNQNLTSDSTNNELLSAITYQSVSSMIKQCEKSPQPHAQTETLFASSANKNESPTMKYPCNICAQYGIWKRNHNRDGSLPSHVRSYDTPNISNASNNRS